MEEGKKQDNNKSAENDNNDESRENSKEVHDYDAENAEHWSYENNKSGDEEDCNYNLKKTTHRKPVDSLSKLKFNSEIETDAYK